MDRVQVFSDKTTIGWIFWEHYSFCQLTVVQGHPEHGLSSLLSLLKHIYSLPHCAYIHCLVPINKFWWMLTSTIPLTPHGRKKWYSFDSFLYIFLSEAILPDCYLQQGKNITFTSNIANWHNKKKSFILKQPCRIPILVWIIHKVISRHYFSTRR